MSAVAPAPASSPTTLQKIEGVAVDTLKLAVQFGSTPEGMAAVIALLGPVSPVVILLTQFGIRALSGILPTISTATVSDADIEAALKAKGVKVEPFDPTSMFKAPGPAVA
jgi:hypothetical protein